MKPASLNPILAMVCVFSMVPCGRGESPFAATVVQYDPAPGQFVNRIEFNDPARAIGAPLGESPSVPVDTSLVSLGGFGGFLTLGFDHTVRDDPANPFGLDFIIYGNAYWVAGDPHRKWAECGLVEISRDTNSNGLADDAWYLIPGSHVADPVGQYAEQTWDDDIGDFAFPPDHPAWIPPGRSGTWSTSGYLLPGEVFDVAVLDNPLGLDAVDEGVIGYADLSPTQGIEPGQTEEEFYTRPDDPFRVGLTPGAGGGDGFDIAWAIDPLTGEDALLDGFDFVRITTGTNFVAGIFGEISTEIDAVADVAEGLMGDADGDGDIDLADLEIVGWCAGGPGVEVPTSPCRVVDFDRDGDVDLWDLAGFQSAFTGA